MSDSPYGDRVRDLIEDAEAQAGRREWTAVRALAAAVLALDPGNPDAERLLREADGAGPDGERRQLTVMFCDVVGSTQLSQAHDPELIREVLRSYQVTCDEVVRRYEGRIARFIGDGVLAYFGHPVTHEDDPFRGVKAGLDLLAAMRPVTEEVNRRFGVDLNIRVAVHTGMVVRADMGTPATPDRDAIVGETPNLAARLQDHAAPGTLVISGATYELVRGWFLVVPRGPLDLRGIDAPVEAFEVVDEVGIDTRIQAQADLSPFVGRDDEVALLTAAWDEVVAGGSGAVVVLGQAGVGKSRLCDIMRRRASAAGSIALVASCSSYHQSTALHPVRRLVERSAGIEAHHDPDQALSRLWNALEGVGEGDRLSSLADLLGIPPTEWCPAPELDGAALREEVLSSLVTWVRGVAARTPTLIVVDDLQWADATTVELITRVLSKRVPGLLLLLAARDDCPIPWPSATVVVLDRLTEDELLDLAQRLPEGRALHAGELDEVVARSDGIPLYLEELLRGSSLARGMGSGRSDIPSALRDLLLARYAAPGVDLRIGQAVATIGPEAPLPVVARVLGTTIEDAVERLDPLVDAGILRVTEEGTYAFRHRLLADLAYDTQLGSVRQRLHGDVADALRDLAGDEPVDAVLQAHHLEQAGRFGEAVTALTDAAQEAGEMAATTELQSLLEHATELLDKVHPSERAPLEFGIRLLRGSSTAQQLGFAAPAAVEDFRVCRELVAQMNLVVDDDEDAAAASERVWSHMGLWANFMLQGELALASGINDDILASLQPGTDLHRYFDVQRSFVGMFRGEWASAREGLLQTLDAIRAVELPRRMPLPHDVEVVTLAHLAQASYLCGRIDEGREFADAGLARAQELSFPIGPFSVCYLAVTQAMAERYAEDLDRSREWNRLLRETSARHGFTFWTMFGGLGESLDRYYGGDEDSGQGVLMTIALLRGLGVRVWVPLFLTSIAAAMVERGAHADALPLLAEALEVADAIDAHLWTSEVHRVTGEARVRAGDPAGLEQIRVGAELARQQGAVVFELWSRSSAVRHGGDEDDRKRLQEVLASLGAAMERHPRVAEARALLAGS